MTGTMLKYPGSKNLLADRIISLIYEERLRGFSKTAFSSFDEKGNRRTEVVWTNYTTTGDLFDPGLYEEREGRG